MQVQSIEPGHAWVLGSGERRRVRTALVGRVTPGDWLLVFLTDARERIDAERAAEVQAALALLHAVMQGNGDGMADRPEAPAFALPSQMTAEQMRALTAPATAPVARGPERPAGA